MNTRNVWYAEIDESGERYVTATHQGTCLHLAAPKPLAWGYFRGPDAERQAQTAALPGLDHERYERFVEQTDDFALLDKVASQIDTASCAC